jgi:ribose transport system substrate-binding protein
MPSTPGAVMEARRTGAQPPSRDVGYTVMSVQRACDILKCFDSEQETLRLDEITARTRLPRPTTFRLLSTLVTCGMLEKRGKNLYALSARRSRKSYRFGYAGQSDEFTFSRLVSESVQRSAYEAGVELILLNNRYSSTTAVRNAERLVREKVDLVIEFQTHTDTAPRVASILAGAGIPFIAIEIPHPGAYFYGANNYRAGWIGGHYLAQSCLTMWGGKFDEVLMLGLPMAGQIPQTRITGMLAGLRELLPNFQDRQVISLNGRGQYEHSQEALRKHLRNSKSRRVLIGAINDPSILGGLRAYEEAGRADHCLAVGQNASIEARREIRRRGSRLVGSVAYFPENYGEAVLGFAFDILRGREVPPALFVKHRMITAADVDEVYPNDVLTPMEDTDSLLYSSR